VAAKLNDIKETAKAKRAAAAARREMDTLRARIGRASP
jgi:hypothetical protein